MNPGLMLALLQGGKAIVMSKTVRLALARYILESVKKHVAKVEAEKEAGQ